MPFRSLAAALSLLALALPVHAQSAVEDPRALGFDPAGLEAIDARIETLAAEGVRPGYAVVVTRGEEIAYIAEAGLSDVATGDAFTADTPVRIASMSKPVTTVAVMMLVEAGAIALDDPVSDYIPAFADIRVAVSPMANADGEIETRAPATVMTIAHLMTHTSGLGYIFDTETDLGRQMIEHSLYSGEGNLEARINSLARFPLYTDPGSRWIYSYANDVLGRIVEVASGMPFEDFLETRLFEPLGMHATGFFFEDVNFDADGLSPLYVHAEDGSFVIMEESFMPDWPSGGGGLISTARDYSRFSRMLANGGALGDVRILAPETLALMMQPQTTPEQLGDGWDGTLYAYGGSVVVPPADGQQARGVPGDYGWGGFFDTDFFVSPATGVSVVSLSQIQPGPHRPAPRTGAAIRPPAYAAFAFD